MEDQEFYRIFLLIYIAFYMLVMYVLNIRSFKKKYNIDPRVVTKNDIIMYKLQVYRDVIFFCVFLNILIYSLLPNFYYLFVPIEYLNIQPLKIAGVAILIISLLVTRISQMHLKGAWRIGIDSSETKGTLITNGIYKISRNPIAMGMLLGTVGLFMVTPNMVTFTIIILVHLIFSIRILLEERHLKKLHGDAYENYCKRTRRWI